MSHVYVQSNIAVAGQNSVYGFRRDPNGALTPLPGSPYLSGGTGGGSAVGEFDSDTNLVTDAAGTLLFSVNSGSNTIAVFRISADGSLAPVAGSPFASGGVNPVSLGWHASRLYAVHKGDDSSVPPDYRGFAVGADAGLTPLPGGAFAVPLVSSPTQALPAGSRNLLFGAETVGRTLHSFQLTPDGSLVLSPGSPVSTPDLGMNAPERPLGLALHPTQNLLYVGFPAVNRLGVYGFNAQGTLSFARTVSNSGRAICWLAVSANGRCLYSANTGSNTISAYRLDDPGAPVEVQHFALSGTGLPFQLAVDPAEGFLYIVSQPIGATPGTTSLLYTLPVDGSTCQISAGSAPIALSAPAGTRSQGIAIVRR